MVRPLLDVWSREQVTQSFVNIIFLRSSVGACDTGLRLQSTLLFPHPMYFKMLLTTKTKSAARASKISHARKESDPNSLSRACYSRSRQALATQAKNIIFFLQVSTRTPFVILPVIGVLRLTGCTFLGLIVFHGDDRSLEKQRWLVILFYFRCCCYCQFFDYLLLFLSVLGSCRSNKTLFV